MEGPLWPVPDLETRNRFLQLARAAFGNRDTLSNTYLSLDNPVSLTRQALNELIATQDYYVACKADGTRFVLCLDYFRDKQMAAFVNRAGDVYMTFVRARKRYFQKGCVFDGEFCVVDNTSHYLVFNVLQFDGINVRNKDYTQRLTIVRQNFPAEPRQENPLQKQPDWQIDSALANVRFWVKPTELVTCIGNLAVPRFPCDGYVFTPANEPVRTGRNEHLLKWKPNNTVDVGFEMVFDRTSSGFRMETWFDDDVTGKRVPLQPKYDISLNSVADIVQGFILAHSMCPSIQWKGIFECWCIVHPQPPHILHVKHTRPDKFTANTPITVERTLQTISENITQTDIWDACLRKTTNLLSRLL